MTTPSGSPSSDLPAGRLSHTVTTVETAAGLIKPQRVDVVIPVYNEAHVLEGSIEQLRAFLSAHLQPHRWRIVVANNASTDHTLEVAQQLAQTYPEEVGYVHLDQKGRGRALKRAWLESDADILSYMDVDLSTGLEAFPLLVQAIINGYDVATGSRLMSESQTSRSAKREFISRTYNLIVRLSHGSKVIDAQCGFKAISRPAVQDLVPLVVNNEWFFDTELLLLAQQRGYAIKEMPVRWVEDPDTRVNILRTALEDLLGLVRVRFRPPK